MDWWAGMNSCVVSAANIGDINQIETIIFDPWNNCDELDLGATQHHQHQQQQQISAAATPAVNSTSGFAAETVIASAGGPDCSCSPLGSAGQHVPVPTLEPISNSLSSSVSTSSSSSSASSTTTENLAPVTCHSSESNNSSEFSSSFGVGQLKATSPGEQQTANLSILCQQQQQQQQHHHHQIQQQQQQQQPPQVQSRARPQHQHQAPTPQKVRRCRHITDYVLAEEEKRLLIKEGYSDFPMTCQARPLSKSEERILRKIRRKIRNKKSAQCSRQRKKEYVEDLERKYATILKENEHLKDLLDQIQQHHQLNGDNHLPVVRSSNEQSNHNNNNNNHHQVQQQHQSNNHANHHQHQNNHHQQQQQQNHAQHLDMNSDWRRMFDNNNSNNLQQPATTIDGNLDFLQ